MDSKIAFPRMLFNPFATKASSNITGLYFFSQWQNLGCLPTDTALIFYICFFFTEKNIINLPYL